MVERKEDINFLTEQYNNDGNSFAVLYGRKGIGKTTLINEFIKDKKSLYYCVKDCNEKEQKFILREEWYNSYKIPECDAEFTDIFRAALEAEEGNENIEKTVIVLDEAYYAFRQGQDMLDAVKLVWDENENNNNLMIIITTSSVQWVENSMVEDLGEFAREITGLLKLKPFGFLEVVNRFPTLSSKDSVYVYGILGGIPGYMDMWMPGKSLRSNIIELFLDKNSLMYAEPEHFLKSELRELSFYNTILYNLACGRNKLNELYARTGYSRAKISVYIKNLIELDIVEKVFSYEARNRDNTKKGVYAIKEPLIHFWYKFVFPNLSELERGNKEYVYDKIIKPELDNYMHRYFVKMSMEYMGLMSEYNKLPFNIELCESWYGKECTIDIMSKDGKSGIIMAGKCKWGGQQFDENDFDELIFDLDKAGEEADYYYLFAQSGFSKELLDRIRMTDKVVVTSLEDM